MRDRRPLLELELLYCDSVCDLTACVVHDRAGPNGCTTAVQLCVWWVFMWGQAGVSAWRCLYRVLCVVCGWVGEREAGGIGLEHLLQCTAA